LSSSSAEEEEEEERGSSLLLFAPLLQQRNAPSELVSARLRWEVPRPCDRLEAGCARGHRERVEEEEEDSPSGVGDNERERGVRGGEGVLVV
jgi:hypothetical protein